MDNAQMVQLLMLKGADNNALADDGVSPLCVAAYCGHEAAAVALLAGGADVSIAVGERKTLILHLLAQQGSQQRHVDILRAVIEYGADVDAVDTNHRTALHFAAVGDKAKIVNALIEAGANIEARDIQGKTPLHLASVSLRLENLTSLLRHGAHCNAQDNFLLTPLHHVTTKAGMKGSAEVVDVLLRSGADETIVDGEGGTAADVVAAWAEEGVQTEDIEHVRKLLANAPADRAWRRRGYLVLCRAHPDRVQETPEGDSALTEAIGNSETVGGSGMGGCAGGEWARMVARVLGLREEGIFRTIVGYL